MGTEDVRLLDRIGVTEKLGSIPCTSASRKRLCDRTHQQLK